VLLAVISLALLGQRINEGKVDAQAQRMALRSHPLLACQRKPFV
jgi:hypothetical protein